MAKSISEEELQLRKRARRRLIGAIALVAAVVIFLPMVLDNEPKAPSRDIDIKIPSANSDNFISKIVPLVSPAPALPPSISAAPAATVGATVSSPLPPVDASSMPSPSESVPAQVPATDNNETPPHIEAFPKKTAPPKSVKKLSTADVAAEKKRSNDSFVVQVAALDAITKAKRLESQLTSAGIQAYTETVSTGKGKVTRVRAGPYKSREEAEKIRAKLKNMGLSGNIVPG